MSRSAHIAQGAPCSTLRLLCLVALFVGLTRSLWGQAANPEETARKIQELSDSIARAQSQIDESQRQLEQMRQQLNSLQQELVSGAKPSATPAPATASLSTQMEEVRERQEVQSSQLATLAQDKVESDSKYPVKLSGLLLFSAFSNSAHTDMAATPTSALFGAGAAGATLRQTVLGVDARGPHLFGAESHADVRMDFDGDPASPYSSGSSSYPGSYNGNATVLRLRTMHAGLDWKHTSIFYALDRPILSPDTPSSLTAVAEPALAWSGHLWSWNPQAGIEHFLPAGSRGGLLVEAALIDVADAPQTLEYKATNLPSTAENRLRPGGELRLGWAGAKKNEGPHAGVGGYFAPHRSTTGINFNSWAATADVSVPLAPHLELSGAGYRGQALGGLGGGAYKDFVTTTAPGGQVRFQSLDALGGWLQLKQKTGERLQFNEAFGADQVFAHQLRLFAARGSPLDYLNFARNRTWTGNVIYSPSAYLLFSFEYRRVETAPVVGRLWTSNVFGAAAGYRF